MARQSELDLKYVEQAEKMAWKDLRKLWKQIKAGKTPGWEPGKAFEHLVIRAFRLNKLDAEYPYHVPPGGRILEQIDGIAFVDGQCFLIECKDEDATDVEAFSKLRIQLLRRPESTLGCLFTRHHFTQPALTLNDLSVPYRILLWSEFDVEESLKNEGFARTLRAKYRDLCKYGLTDHSPYYKELEVT